jgi:hypothetical protein
MVERVRTRPNGFLQASHLRTHNQHGSSGQETFVVFPFWNKVHLLSGYRSRFLVVFIHPGITTDEIVASVFLVDFPEYRGVGTYFLGDAEQEKFLLQHGIRPLNILAYARSLQVGIILISLIILFYLLRRLIGTEFAFICVFIISYDPCYLGNARLLNHEAMCWSIYENKIIW